MGGTLELNDSKLIYEYINQFCRQDMYAAILFCKKWDGTNSHYFCEKQPEDFVMEVLEGIFKGKRCYLNSYTTFRGSVYFHLRFKMLSYFKCRNIKKIDESSPENNFTLNEAEYFYDSDQFYSGCEEIFDGVEKGEIINTIFSMLDPEKDIEEILYLEEYLKGGKREAIAGALGITPIECSEIQRRLIKKITKNKMSILN